MSHGPSAFTPGYLLRSEDLELETTNRTCDVCLPRSQLPPSIGSFLVLSIYREPNTVHFNLKRFILLFICVLVCVHVL